MTSNKEEAAWIFEDDNNVREDKMGLQVQPGRKR
jgi:hypothetical protein